MNGAIGDLIIGLIIGFIVGYRVAKWYFSGRVS